MTGFGAFWEQGDLITRAVALLLLAMSVSAWVTILWKGWLLRRARIGIARAIPAFWGAPTLAEGREQIALFDREGVLQPLLAAATESAEPSAPAKRSPSTGWCSSSGGRTPRMHSASPMCCWPTCAQKTP